MAQLKDTVVQGTLSATDALISTSVQTSILRAPIDSNNVAFGPGVNGQILRSNGTKVYWGTLATTDIPDVYIKKAGNNDGIMTGTLTLHGLKGTADIDYGTTLPVSPTTGQIFFQISDPWYELPPVNSSDNGKILTVVGGQWAAVTKQNELPSVSSSDNGKVLSVVGGQWAAAAAASGDSGISPDGIFYVQNGYSSAAQAYKKGDYILVAGNLSKALTDIASGASFTPANLAPAEAALCGVAERAEDIAGGIGWVEDTNTAVHAISKGDYVLWKGSLCKASAAIAIGSTLSSSNLTAVSGGLGSEVASLSAHLGNLVKQKTLTSVTTDTNGGFYLGTVGTDALTNANSVILCLDSNIGNATVRLAGVYSGNWYAQAFELSTGNLRKSANIGAVTISYIEK